MPLLQRVKNISNSLASPVKRLFKYIRSFFVAPVQPTKRFADIEVLLRKLESYKQPITDIEINLTKVDVSDELRSYSKNRQPIKQAEEQSLEQQVVQNDNGRLAYQEELRRLNSRIKEIRLTLVPNLDEKIDTIIEQSHNKDVSSELSVLRNEQKALSDEFQKLKDDQRELVIGSRHRVNHWVEELAIDCELHPDKKPWYSVKSDLDEVCSILEGGIRKDTIADDNGRFGDSEYGPGLYLSKGEAPYSDGSKPIMVFELIEPLDGVLMDSTTILYHKFSKLEVVSGYDKILLSKNFLRHGNLIPGDSDEICLRTAKGRMVPIGVYMPEDLPTYDDIIVLTEFKMTPINEFCRIQQIELAADFKPILLKNHDDTSNSIKLVSEKEFSL